MYKIVIVGLLAFSSLNVLAQDSRYDKNVKIESNFKSVLARETKLTYNPSIKDTIIVKPSFDYFLKAKKASTFFNLVESEYPKYNKEEINDDKDSFVRLAGGNYNHFLAEAAYNNPSYKKYNWGFYLNSNSTAGRVHSREIGSVEQSAFVYLMHSKDSKSYGASVSYDRNLLHLYDINSSLNRRKDRRGEFATNVFYKKLLNTGTSFGAKLNYTNFVDSKTEGLENYVDLDANANIAMGNSQLVLNLSMDYLRSDNASTYYDDFDFASVSFEPHFKTNLWIFKLDLGLGIAKYQGNNSKFYIYPKSNVYVDIFGKALGFYAKADGDVTNNNYLVSYKNNPYALVEESKQSFNKYTFAGGLKGRFDELFWYNAGASFSSINDYMYYALNDVNRLMGTETLPVKSFMLQKYADVKLFSFIAEAGVHLDENITLMTTFKSYSFSKENILNVPAYELFFNANYKISDKFTVNTDCYVFGKRKTSDFIDVTSKFATSTIIFDFNVNADYKFSNYFQVFARVNNILNHNYQRWEKYPVMGVNALAGFTFSF